MWLEQVIGEHVHSWPEPAHVGLFGFAVHMVADLPGVYPVPTQLLCCHQLYLVDVDLDKVPTMFPENALSFECSVEVL
jgi:hypothetical protein